MGNAKTSPNTAASIANTMVASIDSPLNSDVGSF
jgi:hypothetical protein